MNGDVSLRGRRRGRRPSASPDGSPRRAAFETPRLHEPDPAHARRGAPLVRRLHPARPRTAVADLRRRGALPDGQLLGHARALRATGGAYGRHHRCEARGDWRLDRSGPGCLRAPPSGQARLHAAARCGVRRAAYVAGRFPRGARRLCCAGVRVRASGRRRECLLRGAAGGVAERGGCTGPRGSTDSGRGLHVPPCAHVRERQATGQASPARFAAYNRASKDSADGVEGITTTNRQERPSAGASTDAVTPYTPAVEARCGRQMLRQQHADWQASG